MDATALATDALAQVGLEPRGPGDPDRGVDLVLDVNGVPQPVQLKFRSLADGDSVRRLLDEPRPPGVVLMMVADRVTDAARKSLTARHGGYLDLRGHLTLRATGVLIDVDIDPVRPRAERKDGLSGRAGLEVATALLMRPQRPPAVRELARELRRSPSTVSEICAALRESGWIDGDRRVVGDDLFWQVADRWPIQRVRIAAGPARGDVSIVKPLRLGLADIENEPGWALTDTVAAAAYGASVAMRVGERLDFFVPDEVILRRAITLLGTSAATSLAGAYVRVAPVPAVVERRVSLPTATWPLAHPLFVALDLAHDQGRGREILDAWTPEEPWARVW